MATRAEPLLGAWSLERDWRRRQLRAKGGTKVPRKVRKLARAVGPVVDRAVWDADRRALAIVYRRLFELDAMVSAHLATTLRLVDRVGAAPVRETVRTGAEGLTVPQWRTHYPPDGLVPRDALSRHMLVVGETVSAFCVVACQSIASINPALARGGGNSGQNRGAVDILCTNAATKIAFRSTDPGVADRANPHRPGLPGVVRVRPVSTLAPGDCYASIPEGRFERRHLGHLRRGSGRGRGAAGRALQGRIVIRRPPAPSVARPLRAFVPGAPLRHGSHPSSPASPLRAPRCP